MQPLELVASTNYCSCLICNDIVKLCNIKICKGCNQPQTCKNCTNQISKNNNGNFKCPSCRKIDKCSSSHLNCCTCGDTTIQQKLLKTFSKYVGSSYASIRMKNLIDDQDFIECRTCDGITCGVCQNVCGVCKTNVHINEYCYDKKSNEKQMKTIQQWTNFLKLTNQYFSQFTKIFDENNFDENMISYARCTSCRNNPMDVVFQSIMESNYHDIFLKYSKLKYKTIFKFIENDEKFENIHILDESYKNTFEYCKSMTKEIVDKIYSSPINCNDDDDDDDDMHPPLIGLDE